MVVPQGRKIRIIINRLKPTWPTFVSDPEQDSQWVPNSQATKLKRIQNTFYRKKQKYIYI